MEGHAEAAGSATEAPLNPRHLNRAQSQRRDHMRRMLAHLQEQELAKARMGFQSFHEEALQAARSPTFQAEFLDLPTCPVCGAERSSPCRKVRRSMVPAFRSWPIRPPHAERRQLARREQHGR
jgi:hypothetical protein